jgi:hypothetical protein
LGRGKVVPEVPLNQIRIAAVGTVHTVWDPVVHHVNPSVRLSVVHPVSDDGRRNPVVHRTGCAVELSDRGQIMSVVQHNNIGMAGVSTNGPMGVTGYQIQVVHPVQAWQQNPLLPMVHRRR